MVAVTDLALKQETSNPYQIPPPRSLHRMPPTETPPLHGYPPPQAAAMPPPAWNPTPSPYGEPPDHRQPPPPPPPPEAAHPQPPYQPPPHSYPPPVREPQGYPPDPGYARPGSVSGPTRSPAEHPQYSQPPSTNPHDSPYYQHPPPADYRPRHDYPPPPAQPNGAHQPPLHVVTGHEMMPGQPAGPPQYGPPSAGPPPSAGGYPPYYSPFDAAQRRKPVRAAQACDSCRQRKAKCDEGRPECQHCKDNGLKCSYREIPPQKSEKQVMAITAQLDSMGDDIKMLIANSKAQENKIQLLLDLHNAKVGGMAMEGVTPEESKDAVQLRKPSQTHGNFTGFRREDSQEVRSSSRPQTQPVSSPAKARNGDGETFELSLPAKHTTAAQNLVNWPAIKALIPNGITSSYVMDEETNRGLLRLYGCGEGEDKGDGHEGAPSPAGSSSSDGRRLDDDTASSSPHGVWGSGQFHPPQWSNPSLPAREHPGGVSPNGGLMLDSEAVDKYFRSFMDNIHILHPFLEPKVLRNMIHAFKRKYSWDFRAKDPASVIGHKRKREMTDPPTPMEGDTPGNRFRAHHNVAPIEHSVANAIVLLVLAMGKITAHRDPIPGPAATTTMRTSTPHSNMYSDFPMPSVSAPTSPYNNQAHLNGVNHVAVSSPANPQGKNMDAIPGLAYFAKAADILGELPGGSDVSHIQANLLAGLYMGQLARILPSYFYINKACIAAQILIESTEYVTNTMKPARRNLINFAFWSCLQLESDIAAELELPLSGITRYESPQHKEMPTSVTLERIPESSIDEDILRYYSYQIQLRLTMNSIHSTLYRASKDQQTRPSHTIMSILDENLEDWRKMLNDWDWDDDDYESPNINIARMRAKYYGAKYIIWRPAVHFALWEEARVAKKDRPSESPAGFGGSQVPSSATSNPQSASRQASHAKENHSVSKELLEGCRMCVQAAIRSTTCFDKVTRRLVVTNIFGTAHAQFGNMLVLYAVYTSTVPELKALVDERTLKRLHDRTINILRENENISPVLAKDLKILQHARITVFPPSTSYPAGSTTSSFSSR